MFDQLFLREKQMGRETHQLNQKFRSIPKPSEGGHLTCTELQDFLPDSFSQNDQEEKLRLAV